MWLNAAILRIEQRFSTGGPLRSMKALQGCCWGFFSPTFSCINYCLWIIKFMQLYSFLEKPRWLSEIKQCLSGLSLVACAVLTSRVCITSNVLLTLHSRVPQGWFLAWMVVVPASQLAENPWYDTEGAVDWFGNKTQPLLFFLSNHRYWLSIKRWLSVYP